MVTKVFWSFLTLLVLITVVLYLVIQKRSETIRAINTFVQAGNIGLPIAVDDFTVLESVYSKEMDIYFEYSMMEYEEYSEKVHKEGVLELFQSVVCSTPKFYNSLLENKVRFSFLYKIEGGSNRLFEFTKQNCG